MNGNEHSPRLGRFAAPAGLAVSAAMFLTALSGIASIDPAATAASRATPPPAVRDVSLDRDGSRSSDRRDCPWRSKSAAKRGVTY